jgi:hypothetical protein
MSIISGPTEHEHQVAIFDWIETAKNRVPELGLLFAIPNGGSRSFRKDAKGRRFSPEGQRMKKEGVRSGVPDLMLPVARRGYHGLFIEMKRSGGKASEAQLMWKAWLTEQGYLSLICVGADDAIDKLSWYVGLQ